MRETAVEDAVVGAAATNCARRLAAGLEPGWAQRSSDSELFRT